MRVIYIAGAAHSGSTLLDLMLNAHPDIVSVGEVLKLNRQLAYRDPERKTYAPCSCGAPSLLQCEFWSAVDAQSRASTGKSLAELDVLDGETRDAPHAPNVASVQGHRRGLRQELHCGFLQDSAKAQPPHANP